MTNPEKYYEPRAGASTEPIVVEYSEPPFLERYGELIATTIGLLTFGFALGLVVFALIVRP